ncbi:MAG: aminotransferase class I/II-fold pyridoxal phosphate-dependent enzyme [Fimbriimonadaceae bacterium]|nr:aminotransferase class I/II-fold pyridoxal phosphate-dependent enzyme [Fimbriimonadaceae bacterium]QOJ12242.1 MAG: aminotransferase class I/II-fold pyridoxal phosphate-dependent enzyme [Chthonomonadaceae bacterium]RIJ99344.1 MAG: LL-diaminopimelate aminotransferase [Armatimonadota bacterium]
MPARAHRLDLVPPYLFAEIARIKAEAVASGADVIDLGIGDPDLPTPQPVIDALGQAARNPETHRYDETPRGWRRFLDAAASWYQREFGVAVDPAAELVQLIGSKEGLAHLCWAYVDPSDYVIVPNPGYTVYKVNGLFAGGQVYETPLKEGNGFLPRLDEIPSDVAKRAKLFFVCYPHNPTGAVATPEFYRDLVEFCRTYDILLVNDMAYATVTYDGFRNPTVLQVSGAKEVSLEFHSLSKMFNMTGWRLGFAVGNPDAVQNLAALKSNLDSKQFPAVAEAGAVALESVDNSSTLALYQRRRDLLCDGLRSIGWNVPKPKATFYIWTRVPRGDMSSAEFCAELLRRANVVAIPGSGYGSEGEGYLRMSLTLKGDREGERFAEVVQRIAASGLIPDLVR